MAYTVDANVSDLIDQAYAQSFAANMDVAGVDKREIALYAYNKARLERELQRLISMTRGEKQEPSSLDIVKKEEPIRQPARKTVKTKAADRKAEFRVPEASANPLVESAESFARDVADPAAMKKNVDFVKKQKNSKQVSETVYEFSLAGTTYRYDVTTGKASPVGAK